MRGCVYACAADVEPNITSIRYLIGRAMSQMHETQSLMSSIPRPAVLGRGPGALSAGRMALGVNSR